MKRFKHNLSHTRALTMNMGYITPVTSVPVLPGDSFQADTKALIRALPLNAPVFHRCRVLIEHYFVPNRLVWDEWEDFITGGEDGTAAPVMPYFAFAGGVTEGSLANYYGVPTAGGTEPNALSMRGYVLIYNTLKRNTLVEAPIAFSTASGLDATTDIQLRKALWNKDRFTDATPDPQLGPDVTIPLVNNAPIVVDPLSTDVGLHRDAGTHALLPGAATTANLLSDSLTAQHQVNTGGGGVDAIYDPNGSLYADLSAAAGITIRQLRESSALQRFMEAQAAHGSRYYELLAQWGVKYSDARLQLPEYLGGGNQVLQFSEVLSTSDIAAQPKPGQLYGHGIAQGRSNTYRRTFEEHGYVHTLMTIIPDTMYYQGLPKDLSQKVKTDFYTPQFAFIGAEEILNREVNAAHVSPDAVFGYTKGRYDQYRNIPSTFAGQFQSTLDFWHFGRSLPNNVAFNTDFVTSTVTRDPFQVTDPDVNTMLVFTRNNIAARRIVPNDSTPRLQ